MAKKVRTKQKQEGDLVRRIPKKKQKEAEVQEGRIQMSFEVSSDFKRAYKLYSVEQGMSMLEIFKETFELYKKIYPSKK
ncbi:hypothetical protein Q0590_33935 [Rhodocytophaga aerolata]|uniref:Chromosome partitioning protein ParB n=1 Tax=Rhodocytophaga aerolata TaxID=455078 RepID=A0ABT8RGU0_9BACT|nr:hypothetical protein [Rhodocytophaga aerolata]MDO1451325.1 hypothetical protein [Rhodocytophaga aerolata]